MQHNEMFVELHVPDFELAVEFYSVLGFELVWRDDSTQGYMILRRGDTILNFFGGTEEIYSHQYFGRFSQDTPRGYGVELIIFQKKIVEFFAKLSNQLPENIVEELSIKPWGARDFRVVDPFGFYITITEGYDYMRDRPIVEI